MKLLDKLYTLPIQLKQRGGNFMRIRVEMDVSLPLCRGQVMSMEKGKKSWVTFKYECLPNICYWCGKMDHSNCDYEIWLNSEGSLVETQKQFRSSFCAPPFFPSKRSVVAVPGFYSKKHNVPKMHATEARPEYGDESNDESRAMEELTVVHNLDSLDSSLKAHLWEKTNTPNEPNYSGSGYTGNQVQGPNISPHNPEKFNAENIGINMHEKSGDSCLLSPTEPIGINPINVLIKSSSSNQFQETA